MAPFPLPLTSLLGTWGAYAIYLLIGFAFGYVLEISGFGNSKKLAAQFYFKDLTVLKVMFGAIVVAMVLIFGASAAGLLDYNLVYVNPTYLWPGILGGLIMGFGFIIGGFCPGTSLVAAATAKLDGVFFVLGVFFGIFLFGETVGFYESFWHSSYLGRFTIPEWLGLSPGVVVVLLVLMALAMFWGGEQLERIFGGKDPAKAPRWRYAAAGLLLLGALVVAFVGQPTNADRWARIADERWAQLEAREVQIHPGELLSVIHDDALRVRMLDVRPEADFNLFHILDAERVDPAALDPLAEELLQEPANTVFVVMSNDEGQATEVWKTLVAEAVPNVYILEGGINNWLDTFASQEFKTQYQVGSVSAGALSYRLDAALGARYPAAEPDPHAYALEYTPKVKLEVKRGPSGGGCG
ncbi:MAG: YeeE/YedE thiosulfate transporter family protein [Anaerolineae bacterium]|nr:YeeE/YedE thiosulfate transporter family protein [Anaerolineae bacterium]